MVQLDLELLMTHDRFVRSIARRILCDDADVDDVVQETYRIALTQAPEPSPWFTAWLATVARRLALGIVRTRTRRERLVLDVTPGKPPPTAHEVLEREELRRRVVAAVLELDEPYRGTVLLVHFEGLTPAEAAHRQRVPIDTIRTRLKRARARLREHFERGGDRAGLAGLAGVAATSATTATASAAGGAIGTVLMTTAWKAAIAVSVIGLAAWWIVGHDDVAPTSTVIAPSDSTESAAAEVRADPEPTSDRTPSSERTPMPAATSTLDPARGGASVRGRLIDTAGNPVAGVTVRRAHPAWRRTSLKTVLRAGGFAIDARPCTTGVDGVFTWSTDDAIDELGVQPSDDGSHAIVLESERAGYAPWIENVRVEADARIELGDRVLTGAGVIAGFVRDRAGNAVAKAAVGVYPPPDGAWSDGDLRLFGPAGGVAWTRSDERGAFRFAAVPPGACEVWATTADTRCTSSGRIELVAGAERLDVVVVLEPYAREDTIEGSVRLADGTPYADVMIDLSTRAGPAESHSFVDQIAADGSFVAYCPSPGPWVLSATALDVDAGSCIVRDVPSGSRDVVLTLRPPEALTLRVTDATGARIDTIDVDAYGNEAYSLRGIGLRDDGTVTVPGLTGIFHLSIATQHHAPQSVGPFDAAAPPAVIDVVLVPTPWLRGRVVDAMGEPIAGARVLEQAAPLEGLRPMVQGLPATLQRGETRATTDADGRFRIEAARPHGGFLRVDAHGFAPATFARSSFTPDQERTIVLSAGGVIEGRCSRADGTPCVGAIVVASCGDAYPDTTRCDGEGRFRFEHRSPGPWLVRPWFEEFTTDLQRSADVPRTMEDDSLPSNCVVVDGQVTVLDLIVDDVLRRVTGSVRFEDAPMAPLRVELAVEAGGHSTGAVATDGTFELDAFSDGPATMFVECDGFERFGSLSLQIPVGVAGSATDVVDRSFRGGTVRGRIVGDRKPWMQIVRYAGRSGDTAVRAAVGIAADGSFEFAWLPVGIGAIGVERQDVPIEVTPAGTDGVEVQVGPR